MNLLEETIEIITSHGKTINDVLWVGDEEIKTSWEDFACLANIKYNSGYGASEVAVDLLIVGKDWWLERSEYDGAEWWDFKTIPTKPNKTMKLKALTIGQAKCLGLKVSCGWENLSTINGNIK